MRRLFPRAPRHSLGLVVQTDGLALAQASAAPQGQAHIQHWHWLTLPAVPQTLQPLLVGWPDPAWVRLARQRTGCQAQDTALAIEDTRLRRLRLSLASGLNVREQVKAIEVELSRQLPWALADTVWDFRCLPVAESASVAPPAQRPAWLEAAMQAQAVQQVEVLATQRAWVAACEHWCRAAGLWLVRLEPIWQAEDRWRRQPRSVCAQDVHVLAPHLQAQVGGLALGVLTP